MPSINSDHKWEMSGRGTSLAYMPPPTRSLPSSPPRSKRMEKMSLSLSEMLGDYHQEEIQGDLVMTSSLPSDPLACFRTMGETIEMTNDLLDLTKPLPWDRLKRGASTMSLDSLNENYLEPVSGETAVPEDQDKTPVATCTCGNTTNFECWVHRVPFGGAGELTEEISQTCLQLVKELRSEPSGSDGIGNNPFDRHELDFAGIDESMKDSPPNNHIRDAIDTPCSWKRETLLRSLKRDGDTPSSKSSGSLASAPSMNKSENFSSPDSYDLLYKSFEVAVEMDRLQLERGQSEGSSVGSSLESLNRTSPKLQKVLSQKCRSSPDGSVESPADAGYGCGSMAGSQSHYRIHLEPQYDFQPSMLDSYRYEQKQPEESHQVTDASQKVTFATLAKKKKKQEVMSSQSLPKEVTHWTELVSGPGKEEPDRAPQVTPASYSRPNVGNKPKRPQSLPIQLRHIQKPSSRPQQTPELSQGVPGGAAIGVKGVTRTLSAPEGFTGAFPRLAASGQDLTSSKTTSWVLPPASHSQSTSGLSLLTRKRHYNSQGLPTPRWDPMLDGEGSQDPKMAAGSPLINTSIHDGGHGPKDLSYPYGVYTGVKARVLAMDINANFTELQEQDTFIPEHHPFIPQESNTQAGGSVRGESPATRLYRYGNPLEDRLHFRSSVGAESSSDWVPGQRSTWLDVKHRRVVQPPRTLDLMREEIGQLQEENEDVQTCSRGCSTDSPPAMDPKSFLKTRLGVKEDEEFQMQEPRKESKDVGVSTDEELSGVFWKEEDLCPCAKTCRHVGEDKPSNRSQETDKNTSMKNPCQKSKENEPDNIMKIAESSSSGKVSDTKGQRERKNLTIQEPKSSSRKVPKAKRDQDHVQEVRKETSIQSWRIGGKGRRGSRTIVTCEESHVADSLTNRVVTIQNVGASTLPSSKDKKYIRHRPLKPIRQVDAEHRQRKAVLQKLYGNDSSVVTPLPPTVTAWPGHADSMHSRAHRVHSLPANLNQYPDQSQKASRQQSLSGSTNQPVRRVLSWESSTTKGDSDDSRQEVTDATLRQRPLSLNVSSHYDASSDSLPPQEMQVSPREAADEVNLVQKKALVTSIENAVEHILSHFGQARTKSLQEKGRLGSSAHSPDIGHLMLHYLCPAIRALLLDGLRPHTTSFFVGRLKTTLWDVVEATTQLGPGTRSLNELVRQLTQQSYLKTSELRVNAFLMGLLNIRCLELWLEHIQDHPDIVRSLYEPNAFLSLCNGATRAHFDRLLVAVQPLTLLPFDLDYKFEHQGLVHRQNQQREKQQLMELYARKTRGDVTRSTSPQGGSWLKETAGLFWKKREVAQKPEESTSSSGTVTSSLGFLKSFTGQRSQARTKNSQSSEQPVPGMLKTDENTTPTQGVESTRDFALNKETANSWSLDWIKGFVAASTEGTTSNVGVHRSQVMTSSGSSWSRFGSSLSKAFDRIRPDTVAPSTQQQPHQPSSPNRTPEEEERGATVSKKGRETPTTKEGSSTSQNPVSPGSPVKARCHHVTMSHEELSFTKGSILTVQQQVDPDWLMCSQGNQSGLVHIDYVQGME